MKNLTLLSVAALCAFSCSSAPQRPLKDFLARRDYEPAVEYYSKLLDKNPEDIAAAKNLARVYDHWHKFDSSLVWWEKALELNRADDSSITGRWGALYHRDEDDSTKFDATKELITSEAKTFLAETTERNLTMAWEGLAGVDTIAGPQVAWLLATRFPDSPASAMIIPNAFYDSLYIQGIWYNDTMKVPACHRFLGYFPHSEWRSLFYMTLLSSLYGLKDTAQALVAAKEMVADDTLDPFSWRYAAAILNRLEIAPELAEEYARKAVMLQPKAQKPKNKPEEQWALEYPALYGAARASLAEALKAQGEFNEAERWIEDAIINFKWDANQEATPGPFYCIMGNIQEAKGDTQAALNSYLRAMEAGDSRSNWSRRADSGYQRLMPSTARDELLKGRELFDYKGPVFTDITGPAGFTDLQESRVAWGDYNNDGFQDLLFTGLGKIKTRLFRNDAGAGFTDVTDSVGLTGARGRAAVWADYNNDGWLDFYMAGADTVDRVWRNDSGRFNDVTMEVGYPSDPSPTEGIGWADYDNDGFVDIYCANYENWARVGRTYNLDRLWHNEQGTFSNVTEEAGIYPPYGDPLAGRGISWADYDDDGFQDCFVSNYRLNQNLFWVNNHNSTFTNMAAQLGISGDEMNGYYGHTIGAAWADYDNDGDLDLFTADLAHPRYIEFSNRSRLYENLGPKNKPQFVDRRFDANIRYEETHSNPCWGDVDNDGDLDLYITSIYEGRRSFLYENTGQRNSKGVIQFKEVTWLSGTRVDNGWGSAFADMDNDGDLDLIVASATDLHLYRNDNENGNHWLEVKAVGTEANKAGIGARVTVTQGNKRWIRQVEGGSGTSSQNSLVQHFGLGSSAAPVTVEVKFGPDKVVKKTDVQPDQLVVVEEE